MVVTDVFQATKQEFMSRPAGKRFVPGGCNVHMPRHEFMRLLDFNGWQQCHVCGNRGYLLVDHSHSYPCMIRGLLCDACNLEVGRFEHGHYNKAMFAAIKAYLDNPPTLQLKIYRHYQAYYPEQNEGKAS